VDDVVPGQRAAFTRLRLPKASEFLAQRVRAAILLGDLPEGAPLPSEKELVQQLGVSRATVREGLRLLEAEGLITTRPGRGGGATICRPSPSAHTRSLALLLQFDGATLAELLEARRAIEPLCARLAAERITDSELAELGALLAQLGDLVDDRAEYLAAQVRFHFGIVRAARNAVLRIYAGSLGELIHEQIQDVPFSREDLVQGVAAGAAILDALAQRNPERAERRTTQHLAAIEAALARLNWPLDRRPGELAALVGERR
jgi:DNA-binding FadR family transcriptional regulator